jgi:DNA-binding transcriptional LysR family regulator
VEEGFDLALRIGELTDQSAVATRVGTVRPLVVAAPSYLAVHRAPTNPSELSDHNVIAFQGLFGSGRWTFGHGSNRRTVAIAPRLIVNTAEAAIDAAVSGFGVTRVLSYQAQAAIAEGSLVPLLKEFPDEELPVHLLYPAGLHPAPKLRAFLDFAVPGLRAVFQHAAA